MPRILRSPLARADLLDIWTWIADDASPRTADAYLARLYAAFDRLAALPRSGRVRTEFEGAPRSFVVWPCVVFYEPLADDDGIVIWRVLHGARSFDGLLRPPDGSH
jgi:plasmid stabilization system protein ParE